MHLTATFRPTLGLALRAFSAGHPLVSTVVVLAVPVTLLESLVIGDYTVLIAGAAPLLVLLALIALQIRGTARQPTSIVVTITDTDYRLAQGDKTIAFSWTNFRTVRLRAGMWVLRSSALAATTLPADALDAKQTAILTGFLHSRGLLPTHPTPAQKRL